VNPGFDGIPIKAGKSYNVSFFARQRFMNQPWGADSFIEGRPMPVTVRLESKNGEVLAEASFEVAGREWTRLTATITPSRSEEAARFVLLAKAIGAIALDEILLFPCETFRSRPNGLRADLAQVIADLHPRFIRFPGGCLVHGNGTNNFYRWKDTIGPVEQRRGQRNLWNYHQSVGLGYFEYFQFCEDIGAKPLPVLPAGVCCQNADRTPGLGQQCLPMEEMPAYIQDVLDLIEWANGPASSKWGSKRAEAGHPEPFNLEYLGIGNEDHITPGFKERFQMIYEAVSAKHPEITIVGTVGPDSQGEDYEKGWQLATELRIPIVDEHYYKTPEWFWDNLQRYDKYDRAKSKVYLGEYAAHEPGKQTTLRSALAEAAYMTSLERNGDVVAMSSYAPLLGKRGFTQWNPDLIYFTNTEVVPTVNYHVQQLFGLNAGDSYLAAQVDSSPKQEDRFAFSVIRDSKSSDVILKLVNGDSAPRQLGIEFTGAKGSLKTSKTVLTGNDPMAVNDYTNPGAVLPQSSSITIESSFDYEAPANSLTVLRIKSGKAT
jgi:alpha-L-arabinofuranosidase